MSTKLRSWTSGSERTETYG